MGRKGRRSHPHSLRLKTGVTVAVLVALSAGGAGVIAHRHAADLVYQAALGRGRAMLRALSAPAAIAIATDDYPKLDSFVAELQRDRAEELLVSEVVDEHGRLMASTRNGFLRGQEDSFDPSFVRMALASGELWFAFEPEGETPTSLALALPIVQGRRWGTLLARFSLESLREQQGALTRRIVLFTALAALVLWLAATVLLHRLLLKPTEELAHMARRLGDGELEARIPVRRRDEVGALGLALNRMAGELQAHTLALEEKVLERTRALEAANRELERLATTDPLTGLHNLRYFRESLDRELARSARHPEKLGLCLLDLDHFKTYNDTHGHSAGDALLRELAQLFRRHLRVTDVVARYGGEEFLVLLIGCDTAASQGVAEKLVALVREHDFGGGVPGRARVTISAGVAAYPEDAADAPALVERADRALYEAKRLGRDRAVAFSAGLLDRPAFTSLTGHTLGRPGGAGPTPPEEAS